MGKYKTTDRVFPELKEGESYFCIRYGGWYGISQFRTVIAAKDREAAKEFFETHYPTAKIHSIRSGKY